MYSHFIHINLFICYFYAGYIEKTAVMYRFCHHFSFRKNTFLLIYKEFHFAQLILTETADKVTSAAILVYISLEQHQSIGMFPLSNLCNKNCLIDPLKLSLHNTTEMHW